MDEGQDAKERAVELSLDIEWSPGAPLPFLMSNGRRAAVIVYVKTHDADWDGTYTTIVNPTTDQRESLAVIEFDGIHEVKFGGLNDEALHGHPLFGKGLVPYAAHEVVNSSWITESERRNSAHPYHQPGWHQRLRHFVLCFHDETLECIAEGIRTARITSSFADAVRSVGTSLLG